MTTSAPAATEPTFTQPVLNSRQLRKIAEAVAGYRGSPQYWLVLTEDAEGRLLFEPKATDPGPLANAVVIPCHTPLAAERPPVIAASIRAAGAPPIDLLHLHLDDEMELAHTADAVFWGDSSVEKFVVPYYASVYGSEAGEAVTTLLNSYNGVKTAGGAVEAAEGEPSPTEVYGLVHIPRSEYIELDMPTDPPAHRVHEERFAVLAFNRATGVHRVVTVEGYQEGRGGS